jgi:indole-3-glycerol phosphate synthase
LLIVRILSREKLAQLYALCRELGMDALVEIHTLEEARIVAASDVRLVGINNRNLNSFETDIAVAMELVSQLGSGQLPVAASGISEPGDVHRSLSFGIHNFLVGESIVRAEDSARFIEELKVVGANSG